MRGGRKQVGKEKTAVKALPLRILRSVLAHVEELSMSV